MLLRNISGADTLLHALFFVIVYMNSLSVLLILIYCQNVEEYLKREPCIFLTGTFYVNLFIVCCSIGRNVPTNFLVVKVGNINDDNPYRFYIWLITLTQNNIRILTS